MQIDVQGLTLTLPLNSITAEQFRLDGSYEPLTTHVVRQLVAPGMTAIDVGANVGYFTLLLASCVRDLGHVIAFEPSPLLNRTLRRNVWANALTQVITVEAALAAETGSAFLFRSTSDAMSSMRRIKHSVGTHDVVSTLSFDDFAAKRSINRVDLFKIDVEGAELPVLVGAERSILRFLPILVVEASKHSEAFGYSSHDLFSKLASMGYRTYSLGSHPFTPWDGSLDGVEFVNILALQPSHVARVPPTWFEGMTSDL